MKKTGIKRLKKLLGKRIIQLFYLSLFFLSDKSYIKCRMGKNPVAFNEKLQHLKLSTLIDKLSTRGSSYLPFIRVDMYYCEGKVLVGELAPYNYGGLLHSTLLKKIKK